MREWSCISAQLEISARGEGIIKNNGICVFPFETIALCPEYFRFLNHSQRGRGDGGGIERGGRRRRKMRERISMNRKMCINRYKRFSSGSFSISVGKMLHRFLEGRACSWFKVLGIKCRQCPVPSYSQETQSKALGSAPLPPQQTKPSCAHGYLAQAYSASLYGKRPTRQPRLVQLLCMALFCVCWSLCVSDVLHQGQKLSCQPQLSLQLGLCKTQGLPRSVSTLLTGALFYRL